MRLKIKVVNSCSNVTLIAMLLFLAIFYSKISPNVPHHYNLCGIVDSFGEKSILWYIALGNTFINTLLLFLSQRPYLHNYPIKIAPNNRERVYQASSFFVAVLRLIITLLLSALIAFIAFSIERLPRLFLLALLLSPIVCLIWGVRAIVKAGK